MLSINFKGIRDPDHSKTVLIAIKQTFILYIKKYKSGKTEVEMQLLQTDLKCPSYFKKYVMWKIIKSYSDLSSGPPFLARLYIWGARYEKIPKGAAKAV